MSAALFFRLLKEDDRDHRLQAAVHGLREGAADPLVYRVEQDSFGMIPGSPFAYWVSDAMRQKFQEFPQLEGNAGTVRQGLATADDFRFLRTAWEIPIGLIGLSRENTASGKPWAGFAKGGEYAPFYSDIHLLVNWSRGGMELRAFDRCFIRNEDLYFRPGLTWPRRTQGGLSVRAMPAGCVFADKGPAIFTKSPDKLLLLLALLNSHPGRGLVDLQMAFGAYEVGVLQRIPIPRADDDIASRLSGLAGSIVDLKRNLDTATESSHVYILPALLQGSGPPLSARLDQWNQAVGEAAKKITAGHQEIDEVCFQLYGITTEDRAILEAEMGSEVRGLPEPLSAKQAAADLVSWLVGVVLGRFDVRLATGERPIPALGAPFAALPVLSPGMLPDGGDRPPAGYLVAVPEDGILVDDEGHRDDIVGRVREVLQLLWPDRADAIESEICALLGTRSLRDYVGRMGKGGFWDDHFSRYSKSRRCAPIYWPLQSPHGLYRAWLYAHRLTKDSLPKLLGLGHLGGRIAQVKLDLGELRPGGERKEGLTRKEERRIAELDDLLVDLEEFAARLRLVMERTNDRGETVGYDPDLNDGIVLAAAPLHELIPWPRTRKRGGRTIGEVQAYWEELADGEYDWSRVAMRHWPARVAERCRSDRSLAVAHGLDADLFPALGEELGRQAEPAAPVEGDGGDAVSADEEDRD